MLIQRYTTMDQSVWQGRIDSTENFLAFRWHQCVKPLDLNEEDLRPHQGGAGFALLGFVCDTGIHRNMGRTGAAKGPESIRRELANLPCYFNESVTLFDAGDIVCLDGNLEKSQEVLASAVARLLELNLFPMVLGGGHEVAFGHYKGILAHLTTSAALTQEKMVGSPKIGIFNFDAHFDLRPYPDGGTSGTMFRQIADLNASRGIPFNYFCAGIQRYSNTIELFNTADQLGVDYILSKDLAQADHWSLIERMEKFISENDQLYVTICADVFSSAFAPGVSATQPLGLDPELALKLLKFLVRSGKVVSFDIAEVSPRFDKDNITASLAKVIVFTVVDTICKAKGLQNGPL
jgi:formiminoglutamase